MEYKEPMELKITGDKLVDFLMHAATREDIAASKKELQGDILEVNRSLKEEIAATKTELKSDIAAVKTELKEEIATLRTELKGDIATVKTELKTDILTVNNNLTSRICNLEHTTIDLAVKIEKYHSEMIKFVVWTGVGVTVTIGGMFAKALHWF